MYGKCGGKIRGKIVQHDGNVATLATSDDDSDVVLLLTKKQLRELARRLLTMSEEMTDE